MPGRDGDILARLTTLPQALADHSQKGTLQAQFAQLPPVPQLARQLMTLLGSFTFDWSILPESPRKASLCLLYTSQRFGGDIDQRLQVVAVAAFIR